MYEKNLSLVIEEGHPSYQWAKKQSDSVNAFGHIGTHIDCYESEPTETEYEVNVIIINSTEYMPSDEDIATVNLSGKALILFTGNIEKNKYGTPEYGAMDTAVEDRTLESILTNPPAFIVIDSYGIGHHGEEHISFDKKCESKNCFVIENVALTQDIIPCLKKLRISFDRSSASTGKRCNVTGILSKSS